MNDWMIDEKSVKQHSLNALEAVSQGFEVQIRQAKLRAEYDALQKEEKYNDDLKQIAIDIQWLRGKKSSKLMELLNFYHRMIECEQKLGFWFRLKWSISMGTKMYSFLGCNSEQVIRCLESAYYHSRKAEIESEFESITTQLQSIDIKKSVNELRSSSLELLKNKIAKRYH